MLTFADGQLAATSGTILDADAHNQPRCVTVALGNTSASSTEVVVLTLTRAGSTARRIARLSLAANETAQVRGVAMDPGDVLSGYATDASTVDYTVFSSPGVGFEVVTSDSSGGRKNSTSGTAGSFTLAGDLVPAAGGSKIGGASDKLAFYGQPARTQPTGTGTLTTGFTKGADDSAKYVQSISTFTGNVGSTTYTVSDIVAALKNLGLIAS